MNLVRILIVMFLIGAALQYSADAQTVSKMQPTQTAAETSAAPIEAAPAAGVPAADANPQVIDNPPSGQVASETPAPPTVPPLSAMPTGMMSNPGMLGMQVSNETAQGVEGMKRDMLNKMFEPATPVPTGANAQAAPDAARAQVAAGTGPVQSKQEIKIDEPEIFTNTNYRSLMFKRNDVERIKYATEAYKYLLAQRRLGRDIVTDVAPAQPTVTVIDHPQFYLASIVYRAAGDWSVWLNGAKYTAQQPSDGDIIVQDVDKEKAVIIWRPAMFANYKNRLPVNVPRVSADASEGTVTFTLFANQTFSAFTMKIHEGMLPPVYREQITVEAPANTGVSGAVEKMQQFMKPDAKPANSPQPPVTPAAQGSALTRPDSQLPQTKLPAVPQFQPPPPPGAANR